MKDKTNILFLAAIAAQKGIINFGEFEEFISSNKEQIHEIIMIEDLSGEVFEIVKKTFKELIKDLDDKQIVDILPIYPDVYCYFEEREGIKRIKDVFEEKMAQFSDDELEKKIIQGNIHEKAENFLKKVLAKRMEKWDSKKLIEFLNHSNEEIVFIASQILKDRKEEKVTEAFLQFLWKKIQGWEKNHQISGQLVEIDIGYEEAIIFNIIEGLKDVEGKEVDRALIEILRNTIWHHPYPDELKETEAQHALEIIRKRTRKWDIQMLHEMYTYDKWNAPGYVVPVFGGALKKRCKYLSTKALLKLLNSCRDIDDGELIVKIIKVLRTRNGEQIRQRLLEFLKSENVAIVFAVMKALEKEKGAEINALLAELLKRRNTTLGESAQKEIIKRAITMLKKRKGGSQMVRKILGLN